MQTHKIETRTKGASLLLGIVRLSLTNQSQLPASNWKLPSPETNIFAEDWCLENDPETFCSRVSACFYGAKIFALGHLVVSTHPKGWFKSKISSGKKILKAVFVDQRRQKMHGNFEDFFLRKTVAKIYTNIWVDVRIKRRWGFFLYPPKKKLRWVAGWKIPPWMSRCMSYWKWQCHVETSRHQQICVSLVREYSNTPPMAMAVPGHRYCPNGGFFCGRNPAFTTWDV